MVKTLALAALWIFTAVGFGCHGDPLEAGFKNCAGEEEPKHRSERCGKRKRVIM